VPIRGFGQLPHSAQPNASRGVPTTYN
jgi:hypothetical protein